MAFRPNGAGAADAGFALVFAALSMTLVAGNLIDLPCALVVDTRASYDFANDHLACAINFPR